MWRVERRLPFGLYIENDYITFVMKILKHFYGISIDNLKAVSYYKDYMYHIGK